MSTNVSSLVEHTCRVELRPNDFDWAGHLNSGVHPQLLEVGRWKWGIANGIDLRGGQLVAVVVSLHLDYVKPIGWDPVGQVVVRTALVTTTAYSYTLRQDIECADATVMARGHVRLALVDRETQRIHRVDLTQLQTGAGATI